MDTVDLIVQPRLTPRESLAADGHLLTEVARGGRAALRLYELSGEVLSLGRYHLAPEPVRDGVQLWRRRSGGRAVPAGEGFVGLSLVLPHRSALVAAEPLALEPAQVLNRAVRGLLEACQLAGAAAFYPGRDLITVERRILGLVSFDVDETGACLVEAIVAGGRDFSLLPALLDVADPRGVVTGGLLTPDDATCLARETGREVALDALAEWLREGYRRRLGLRCEPRAFTAGENALIAAAAARDFADERWLFGRRVRADLDRRVSVAGQLGVLDVHFAVDGGRIRDVCLAGDFIANAPAIERLERELRGCRAERDAIAAVVDAVFAAPGSFILGVGPASTITETLVRGLAA